MNLALACQKANEFVYSSAKNFQKIGKVIDIRGFLEVNLVNSYKILNIAINY